MNRKKNKLLRGEFPGDSCRNRAPSVSWLPQHDGLFCQ
jgi:hypothetical protein